MRRVTNSALFGDTVEVPVDFLQQLVVDVANRIQNGIHVHAKVVGLTAFLPDGFDCTPIEARWCAEHGTCRCDPEGGDHPDCPLHSPTSTHGTGLT